MSANREKTLDKGMNFIFMGIGQAVISCSTTAIYCHRLSAGPPDRHYLPTAFVFLLIMAGVLGLISRGCLSTPKEKRWSGIAAGAGVMAGLLALCTASLGGLFYYQFANGKTVFVQAGWLYGMNTDKIRLGPAPFLYFIGSIGILVGLFFLRAAEED